MKPTLLMNVGTSFSASSPLHYTLGWDNKYCHTGHTKEHQYLYITQVGKKAWGRRYAAKKREKRRREEIEQGGFTSKPDVLISPVRNIFFPIKIVCLAPSRIALDG